MEGAKGRRRRAVVLTAEAHHQLTTALFAAWREQAGDAKLTREQRADLVGLSMVTTDRILKNQKVDRASLQIAFARLGLTWREAYCVSATPPEQVARPVGAQAFASGVTDEVDPDANASTYRAIGRVSSQVPPARRKRPVTPLRILAACLMLAGAAAVPIESLRHREKGDLEYREAYGASFQRGLSAFHQAHYHSARAETQRALDLAREARDMYGLSNALLSLGNIEEALGDLEGARQRYQEALSLVEILGERGRMPPIHESLGTVASRMGAFEDAERHLQASLELSIEFGNEEGAAQVHRSLGALAYRAGALEKARGHLFIALQEALRLGKSDLHADVRAQMATILRDEGRLHQARGIFQECLNHWTRAGHERWIARTVLQIATVDVLEGKGSEARERLKESRRTYQALGDPAGVAECDRWQGKLRQEPSGTSARSAVQDRPR
jgi:tetratricopeptide (TPR) repeat protein